MLFFYSNFTNPRSTAEVFPELTDHCWSSQYSQCSAPSTRVFVRWPGRRAAMFERAEQFHQSLHWVQRPLPALPPPSGILPVRLWCTASGVQKLHHLSITPKCLYARLVTIPVEVLSLQVERMLLIMSKDFKDNRLCFDVLHKRFCHFHSNLFQKWGKKMRHLKNEISLRSLYFSYHLLSLTVKATAFPFSLGINFTLQ